MFWLNEDKLEKRQQKKSVFSRNDITKFDEKH